MILFSKIFRSVGISAPDHFLNELAQSSDLVILFFFLNKKKISMQFFGPESCAMGWAKCSNSFFSYVLRYKKVTEGKQYF